MESQQIVSFKLDQASYGIDILKVQEIMRMTPITKIPSPDPCLKGIINVRGKIVPIIDTRRKLEMESGAETDETRLLLINKGTKVAGLLVDEVSEVLKVEEECFEPAERMDGGIANLSRLVTGIVKLNNSLLTIIDSDLLI